MKKRILSILLVLVLLLQLVPTIVLAENTGEDAFTNIVLQLGADESQMNFTWYTASDAVGSITFCKKAELDGTQLPDNAVTVTATRTESVKTGYYANKAVITGLEPDTEYCYQLSDGSEKTDIATFTTGGAGDFSFAVVGDPQIGRGQVDGSYTDEALQNDYDAWDRTLQQLATDATFDGVDFMVSVGDQINSSFTDSGAGNFNYEDHEKQFDAYSNHDVLLSLPTVVTLGNHDNYNKSIYAYHFNEPNLDTSAGATYDSTTNKVNSADYYFVYNKVLFIVLNNNDFVDYTGTDEARAKDKAAADAHGTFIRKVMKQTQDEEILWKIVVYHRSPYGSSYHNQDVSQRTEQYNFINMREYLMPYLYENGIDLVLSGHDHCYTRTHVIKPDQDEDGNYIDASVIDTESYTYAADGTTPVSATDPDGILHVTAATSSGSQVNPVVVTSDYTVVNSEANTRQMIRVDVTDTSLTLVNYNLGTATTDEITEVDSFTIYRTGTKPEPPFDLDEDGSDTIKFEAAYAPEDSITVDGDLSEKEWSNYGKLSDGTTNFGLLWDKDNLYLSMTDCAAAPTVTLNGVTLTAAQIQTVGTTVEATYTLSDAGFVISDYTQTVDLSLTVGDASWSGALGFIPLERKEVSLTWDFEGYEAIRWTQINKGDYPDGSESLGYEAVTNGAHFWNKYIAEPDTTKYQRDNENQGRLSNIDLYKSSSETPWIESYTDGVNVIEYDFTATDMPLYSLGASVTPAIVCYGMVMHITDSNGYGLRTGIANTGDGLYFFTYDETHYNRSIKLDKQEGDQFHVRIAWMPDGSLEVYVDDVLKGSLEEVTVLPANMSGSVSAGGFTVNLYDWGGALTADGARNADFTVADITFGTCGPKSVMDSLTFDSIRGANLSADEIRSDLELPTALPDTRLGELELVWTSSVPSAISNDGVLAPVYADTEVVLTATIQGSNPVVSKSFRLTAKQMTVTAYAADTAATLDGSMSEYAGAGSRAFSISSGGVSGQVTAIYNNAKVYLAVEYENATELKLTLGDALRTIALSGGEVSAEGVTGYVNDGVAELCADLAALGITLEDYNRSISFQLQLVGDSGSASLEENPISLLFSGIVTIPLEWKSGNDLGSKPGWLVSSLTVDGETATFAANSTYHIRLYENAVDHNKNMELTQKIYVESMPSSDGAFKNNYTANGYCFWISDVELNGNSSVPGSVMEAVMFHTGDDQLKLNVRKTDGTVQTVELGKAVGDTFTLSLQWKTDHSVSVLVDGALADIVSDVNYIASDTGTNAIQNRYYGDTAAIHVSDMALKVEKYTSLAEELTVEALLGDVDFSSITEDIQLDETYASPYLGTVPLVWSSSDTSILRNDGSVIRPEGKAGKYVNLTLSAYEKVYWSQECYVVAENAAPATSPTTLGVPFTAATPTLDGVLTDEGWNLNTMLQTAEGVQIGRFGAQWDTEYLYLAIETGGAAAAVTLGGIAQTLPEAVDNVIEMRIPLTDLGISNLNYGQEITAVVTLSDAQWQGKLVLTSTDWFAVDGTGDRISKPLTGTATYFASSKPTENQGVETTADGWHFYDYYDADGDNPPSIQSYSIFTNNSALHPLGDRTVASYAEFDFYAASMPEYTLAAADGSIRTPAAGPGFNWQITGVEESGVPISYVSFSIFNTADGLYLAARGATPSFVALNKSVGELFRVGVRWEINGDATVFIDGEEFATFKGAELTGSGVGDRAFAMRLIRSSAAAADRNDDFDVTISNIALGKNYGDSVLDLITYDDLLGGEDTDPHSINEDLTLPTGITNPQTNITAELTWSSDMPNVISDDGKVTHPDGNGKAVTMTVTDESGNSKSFIFYVQGLSAYSDVLCVENDVDTANGAGKIYDIYQFALDATNNSIIYDQKTAQTVNVIKLIDSDEVNRLNESVLSIWVSEDNVTYTRLEDDFKILRDGRNTYLYDFEVTARYIKVHCTYFDDAETDFIATPSQMLQVYYEEIFGFGGASDYSGKELSVTNNGTQTVYDGAWRIAGAAGEKARVYLGDELLYHYVDGDDLIVRIPKLEAGETAVIDVFYGNEDDLEIANKEFVHEVVYGTREALFDESLTNQTWNRWICALPDGRLMGVGAYSIDDSDIDEDVWFSFSDDMGLTWSDPEPIIGAGDVVRNIHSISCDPNTGTVFVVGFTPEAPYEEDPTKTSRVTRIFYSEDMGQTWNLCPEMTIEGDPAFYYLTYTDVTALSTADGAGPEVDYVLPLASLSGREDNSFEVRVAYSVDGGKTWTMGADKIRYEGNDLWHYEVGMSEGTIGECEDGTLVLFARNQFGDVDNFGVSCSYDHGKTWVEEATLSNVYTVNTQPLFHTFNGNKLLTWGGNNVLGGNSYKRWPLNVAITYDDYETFENIQDLYSRYYLQDMTGLIPNDVTNQSVASVGDDLTMLWGAGNKRMLMRIEDFTSFFYRTKGAYDSFENSSSKYEGWSTTMGIAEVSAEQSFEGDYSMRIARGSGAVRSVPYVQNGTISFELYLNNAATANVEIELESAYGAEYGKAAPVAFTVRDGKLCFLADDGSEYEVAAGLQDGWNSFVFDLGLLGETPSVTLSVNGADAFSVPVNTVVGDYICYVDIANKGSAVYLDSFLLIDEDNSYVPEEEPDVELEKNGLVVDEDGEIRYYVDGVATYAGVVADEEGNLYYIDSTKTAVKSCTCAISEDDTNGLVESGTYEFGADGKMIVEPDGEDPTEPDEEDPTEPDGEDPTEPDEEDPTEPDEEDPAEPDSGEDNKPGDKTNLTLLIAVMAIGVLGAVILVAMPKKELF